VRGRLAAPAPAPAGSCASGRLPDGRGARRSPAVAKRSHLSGSWDDLSGAKRMLKASLNSEDLSLLLDSLESSRASPSLSRALRLSPAPSPATSRFLSSPAIPRKLSQSLSSLLAISHGATNGTNGITSSTAGSTAPVASPAVPRQDVLSSTAALPTLSVTPPVPATPPSDHMAPLPTLATATNPAAEHTHTLSSLGTVSVEQSGHVPVAQQRLDAEYVAMTSVNASQAAGAMVAHAPPHYMPPSELGFYAEQVVLPPAPGAPGYSVHMGAEGEAFNYSYVAKCADGSQHQHQHQQGLVPQVGYNCKCGAKDFRAIDTESHSPSTCKANGHCPLCSTKNFVVSEPNSKHLARKHGGVKTYHCNMEDCDKTFITRKEQQNHIARHSAEPRYYCEYQGCNCKYTTKSSLDLHVTRIHGEKRFRCDLCEERYSVRGDLNQHMKRKHMKQRRV